MLIKTYDVSYLLPYRQNSSAQEDKLNRGYYLHVKTVIARSEQEAWQLVNNKDLIPVKAREIKPPLFKKKPSRTYRQEFLKAIDANIKGGGISPQRALMLVIDSETSNIRHHFTNAISVINSGGSFAEAIAAIGFYDNATISILEAGERTGRLAEALSAAIEQYEASGSTIKLMLIPITYMLTELLVQFSFSLGNMAAIPVFRDQAAESMNDQNKAIVQEVIAQFDWLNTINNYLVFFTIIFGAFFLTVLIGYFSPIKKHKDWADAMINRIPFLNQMLINSEMASSSRVMSNLLAGGVIIQRAMPLVIKSATLPAVKRYFEDSFEQMENGKVMTEALSNHEILLPVEKMRLRTFSNSKQLADIFKSVIYIQRTELANKYAKRFTKMILLFGGIYILIGFGISVYIGNLATKTML
jgi:type II secretory pathway component PulF